MLVFWVWFSQLPVSNFIKRALLEVFGDPEHIYYADPAVFSGVEGMTADVLQHLSEKDLEESRRILQLCRDKDLKLLPFSHPGYPERLRQIADPPVLLYLRGKLPQFEKMPAIAVVGTRKCSPQGLEIARKISSEIAACGGLVVTGMASGIDAQAAWGALDAGRPVVGVLGTGAEIVYPASNRKLFDAVMETGCVLSEYPPETPSLPWHFPERNRIISGICCGTLVVEAPERSGALITARSALEQGRDVFVVPGAVTESRCAGSNQLLRQGAAAVFSGWDVVSEYAGQYPVEQRNIPKFSKKQERNDPSTGKKQDKTEKTTKIIIDKGEQSPYSESVKPLPGLTEEEAAIAALLASGEKLTDAIAAETGMGAGAVLSALTMLEIKGVIRRLPGNRVALRER